MIQILRQIEIQILTTIQTINNNLIQKMTSELQQQQENAYLKDIQTQNQQAKKKLEKFKSGIEKMMKKKSNIHKDSNGLSSRLNKKIYSNFQQPSNDKSHQTTDPLMINPSNKYKDNSNYYSNNKNHLNNNQQKRQSDPQYKQYYSQKPLQNRQPEKLITPTIQGDFGFGFNSTLFKNIAGNDSVVMSNASSGGLGMNSLASPSNFGLHKQNYHRHQNHDQPYDFQGGYYEKQASNSNSSHIYSHNANTNINNNNNDLDSFKRSQSIYSKIDELMAKVNKNTTKLPIKQIEKFINKKGNSYNDIKQQQSQKQYRSSNSNLSGLSYKTNQNTHSYTSTDFNYHAQEQIHNNNHNSTAAKAKLDKLKTIEQIQENARTLTLLNDNNNKKIVNQGKKQKSFIPPLPSPKNYLNKQKQQNAKNANYLNYLTSNSKSNNEQLDSNKSPIKKSNNNSVEAHKSRLQDVLSERKKSLQKDGLDDSIDLQLSDEDSSCKAQNENEIKNENQHENITKNIEQNNFQGMSVDQLIEQRKKLMQQLEQVQNQLEKIEFEDSA